MDEWTDIQPHEVSFKEQLFNSENSLIYIVTIRGETCVMKVYDDKEGIGRYVKVKTREYNRFICETTAYRRMRERGLYDRGGFIPKLYGALDNFDPKPYHPYLRRFQRKEELPSAIFLEYIPNLERFTLERYTETIFNKFIQGMEEINKALVLHGDTYPRNMFIVKDDPEKKVFWLDFDHAQTFHEDTITEHQRYLLNEEKLFMRDFKDMVKQDIAAGTKTESMILF